MGQFASTVEFYAYRERYPPLFFRTVAERLQLDKSKRQLDIGTGPGPLAIGFAPFVGTCTAVDREPEMLQAAGTAAASANARIEFIQGSIEDLEFAAGSFDFVTIGRALHWLPLDRVLPTLERIVVPAGTIAICSSTTAETPSNRWIAKFKGLRTAWSSNPEDSRHKIYQTEWFAGSRFRKIDEITVRHQQKVTVDELVKRALSFSGTSPEMLGERRKQFEREIVAALEPFACSGELDEELAAKAFLVA
jgi:SAM-dependent methyltransferase